MHDAEGLALGVAALVRVIEAGGGADGDAERDAVLQALAALPLTPSWRRLVEGRLARGGVVEDWTARLDGTPHQP